MSALLAAFGIPVALLGFVALMFGLAKFKPIQQKPQLLKWIHLGGWGFTLLLFAVYVGFRVSLRGQWADVVPFGIAWLAAGSYFLLRRRQLGWAGKLYFGSWFLYPAALAGAYLLDRIFFALVSLPVLAFIPHTSYYTGPECSIRDATGGFLGARRITLLTPKGFVLEKHHGVIQPPDELGSYTPDSVTLARTVPSSSSDSVAVMLSTASGSKRHVSFPRE
ncbi:hypothetical protein GCM10027048_04050 [Hymenobacter coalescens]